jgi:uncharacterized membrane protein
LFTGVLIAFIAAIIPLFIAVSEGVHISTGGCILIGFIPICFGSGEYALHMAIIAIIKELILFEGLGDSRVSRGGVNRGWLP